MADMKKPFVERMGSLDRRWIYLAIALAVIIPLVFRVVFRVPIPGRRPRGRSPGSGYPAARP